MSSKYNKPTTIDQWSYSRYSVYESCPFKAKCKFVDKIKEPPSYPMQRGLETHAKAENLVKGNIKGTPKELAKFRAEFHTVSLIYKRHLYDSKTGAFTEIDLAVALDRKGKWIPSRYDDWNNVWCRSYGDLLVVDDRIATYVDYKTGRAYPSHMDQGELSAINTMIHFPAVNIVDTEFWYLDSGEVDGDTYHRKNLRKLQLKWLKKVKSMLTDTKFEATPNQWCSRCFFSKTNDGPCEMA